MYTGLRGCDISALTLNCFDWEHDLIRITQAKTGQPLSLPLRAVVGNTVFDYLLNERPKCREPYVFLTVHVPHRRLHTSNLDAICSKVMCKAGIRQGKNERKSMHLFRHHVATSMLQAGMQQPVISATLGHASLDSLDHYLSAEFKETEGVFIEHRGVSREKGGVWRMKTNSFLSDVIKEYVKYRKASGRDSYSYVKNVILFDHFCAREYPRQTEFTQEIVDS